MLHHVKFFAAALLALLTACARPPAELHGTTIDPARQAAGIEGIDGNGKPFALDSLRGTPVAVYFGFTRCKDTCPQTLALLQKARTNAGLSPHDAAIVFVSVDPGHDRPNVVKAYLAKRNLDVTGVTGSPKQTAEAERAYGVAVKPSGDDLLHGDFIYMIDKGGRLRELLHPDSAVADVTADWKALAH